MGETMYYVYWVSKISGAFMPGGICDTEEKASQMSQDLAKRHNTESDFFSLPYNHLVLDEELHKY